MIGLASQSIYSQSYFTTIQESEINLRSDQERTIVPNNYEVLALDMDGIKQYLSAVPHELDDDRQSQELNLKIPMPDGTFKTFMIYESPTMMEEISARYPNIKSYKGYGRSNDYENIRISINKKGFYAAIRTVSGTVYIDPYSTNTTTTYISYFVKDHEPNLESHQLACGTHQDPEQLIEGLKEIDFQGGETLNISERGDNIPLRQYRLAIACTGEFGQLRQDIEEVLADINTTVTRLNQIFENDLSIRMILIDRNDEIIYDDPQTDPYDIPTTFPNENEGSGRWLLVRNTAVINNTIGAGSYDLGHIYHRACTDVGGVAFLGSICSDIKGGGVTCHSSSNLEFVTVSIAAHEMGHQLGSPHSFNNCSGQNESLANGFEPGSGTTIMSYAGLNVCSPNNLQSNNDDYYHVGSLMNIYQTTRLAAESCAEEININNHAPDIQLDYVDGFYIPIETPFILTGNATDEDGNNMTYSWEQTNSGPRSPLGEPSNNAPAFRVFYPNEEVTRIFPRPNSLLANATLNSEVLATYNRDYTFQFVVRDNNPGGGTVSWDHIDFRASDVGGPFLVTSNNQNMTMTAGKPHTITWDVAGTDQSPINCNNVDIYISYDSEINTDVLNEDIILLARSTPNDGAHQIVLPTRLTTRARFIVRASNNIFFDVSNRNNTIEESAEPAVYFESDDVNLALCSDAYTMNISTEGLGGYEGDIRMEVSGLPNDATAIFSSNIISAGEDVSLNIDFNNVIETGDFEINIMAIAEGIDTLERVLPIQNIATDFSDLTYIGPNGIIGGTTLPTLEWIKSANAVSYHVEISTSPSFEAATIVDAATIDSDNFTPSEILDVSSVYYWRVRAENECRIGEYNEVFAFSTESLSCQTYNATNLPINISQSGTPSIKAEIPVSLQGQVADVNVKKIRGLHERNKDLSGYLVAPDGSSVKLFGDECGNQSNFNCGFDDESPNPFSCPLSSGQTYRSDDQELSLLNGKDINGLWKFQLDDNQTGNSGKLEEVVIEICSNVSLNPPVLVNNRLLELPPGTRDVIQSPQLLTTDPDNNFDEIIYTLVEAPQHGAIQLNLVTLEVGDQWTQNDIQFNNVTYLHSDDGSEFDQFKFDVIDGEGGWIEITNFEIAIDDSFVTNTADTEFDNDITLYPNPANESIYVSHNSIQELSIRITDLTGKTVITSKTSTSNKINTSELGNGIYLVEISSGDKLSVKKMVIQR